MKKFVLSALALATVLGANAENVFNKGDRKATLTIGVGTVDLKTSNATFDQHLSMEWGVMEFADKFTLGAGVAINNQYGAKMEGAVSGSYNYTYTIRNWGEEKNSHGRWAPFSNDRTVTRKGDGYAKADNAREDFDVMGTVSLHFSPMSKLDTYFTFGLGVGCMSYIVSNIHDEQNFGKANYENYTETSTRRSHVRYSYNDLDHVKWNGMKTKACAAVAAYLGATYYVTPQIGVDMQIGLIDANVKSGSAGYPSSFGVFAVGASYKF